MFVDSRRGQMLRPWSTAEMHRGRCGRMKLDRAQLRVHALGISLVIPCCIASVLERGGLCADSTPTPWICWGRRG